MRKEVRTIEEAKKKATKDLYSMIQDYNNSSKKEVQIDTDKILKDIMPEVNKLVKDFVDSEKDRLDRERKQAEKDAVKTQKPRISISAQSLRRTD